MVITIALIAAACSSGSSGDDSPSEASGEEEGRLVPTAQVVFSGPGDAPGDTPTKLLAVGEVDGRLFAGGYLGIPARDCGVPWLMVSDDDGASWQDQSEVVNPAAQCGTIRTVLPDPAGGVLLVGDLEGDEGGITVWRSADGQVWDHDVSRVDDQPDIPIGGIPEGLLYDGQLLIVDACSHLLDTASGSPEVVGNIGFDQEAVTSLTDGRVVAGGFGGSDGCYEGETDSESAMVGISEDGGRTWEQAELPAGSPADMPSGAGSVLADGNLIVGGTGFDGSNLSPVGWTLQEGWQRFEFPDGGTWSSVNGFVNNASTSDRWIVAYGGARFYDPDTDGRGTWYSCDAGDSWTSFPMPLVSEAEANEFTITDARLVGDSIVASGYEEYGSEYSTRGVVWRIDLPEDGCSS